jgi:uncharacterized membrane protein HdeD (DUF308 family)
MAAATLVLFFGAWVLIDGILRIVGAIGNRSSDSDWGWQLVIGILGVFVGFFAFHAPGITALGLVIYIAAWALMIGVTEIALAIKMRREIKGEWFLILMGLASIIFAGLLFWNPIAGAATLIWIIAWYALIIGALEIVFGIRLLISQLLVTYPDVNWEVRTPAEVGLDGAKLQAFSAFVGGNGAIVRNGYMVYTWGNQSARSSLGWASASKSILGSTSLFFAMKEGHLPGGPNTLLQAYVQQQFPGQQLTGNDVTMTFYHLANAVSGYALPDAPSAAWNYDDYAFKLYKFLVWGKKGLFGVAPVAGTHMMSPADGDAIASAITTLTPARLGPLKCQDGLLVVIHNGSPQWNATIRDTARVAWFLLNKGQWKTQQLLPQAYFDTYVKAQVPWNLPQSTSHTATDYLGINTDGSTDPNQNPTNPYYGFNWIHNLGTDGSLLAPGAPTDLFFAQGNQNKMITMVPSQNLVAVWRDGPSLTKAQRATALTKLSSAVS